MLHWRKSIAIVLLLFPATCFALLNSFWYGGGGGGSCTTEQMAYDTGTSEAHLSIAINSYDWRSTQFTYIGTNGKSICGIELWLAWYDTGGDSPRNYTFYIYSDNSGVPASGGSLGNSDTLDFSDDRIGGTKEWYYIPFTTPTSALTTGSTYHIVVQSGSIDTDDYLEWHGNNDQLVTRNAYSTDGASWTADTNNAFLFRLYSQ